VKFGPIKVADAGGAVVAHAVRRPGLVLKKGDVISAAAIAALREAGVAEILAARFEEDDIGEDPAAAALAKAVVGANVRVDRAFTGRANLFATSAGVLRIDAATVDAINARDEAITIATLPDMRAVVDGEMVATVKIIPFAVPRASLEGAVALSKAPVVAVSPYKPLRVAVISTILPGLKPSVIDKTVRILEDRLAMSRATIVAEDRVPHEADALAPVVARFADAADLTIIFGASAITDRRDVIPSAIVGAGGAVEYFGMPVDPGNLLLLARSRSGTPIIGAPGCARSPKENGFDFVLQRLLAGIEVTPADIRRMGVGGLLMEIVSRPQPRGGGASRDDAD
jgi:molybdenum cofactor cytidylyltransferase